MGTYIDVLARTVWKAPLLAAGPTATNQEGDETIDVITHSDSVEAAEHNLSSCGTFPVLTSADIERKIQIYRQMSQTVPYSFEAWSHLGYYLAQADQCLEAIEAYVKALQIRSKAPRIWYNYATLLEKMGWYGEAVSSYQEALAISPDYFKAMYGKSKSLYRLGRYQEAVDSYDQAIASPMAEGALAAELWYGRGKAFYRLQQLDEALASLEQALAILQAIGLGSEPSAHKVWASLGQVLMSQRKDAAALEKFDRAIALAPTSALYWTHKGFLLKRLGRYEEALAAFDEALALGHTVARIWHHRGLTLMKIKRYPEAHHSFTQALKHQAYDYKSWLSLAWALEKMGDYNLAIEAYNKSLAIEPDQSFAFYQQARCYAVLQQPSSAAEYLRRAIALHPEAYAPRSKVDPVFREVQSRAMLLGR
mgnify:CR=1 FL=1